MENKRDLSYFVADVHLGLDVKDPSDREARFVAFLKSVPAERTEALYLLGDIWDFWYEYRDVVPKGYIRVFAALTDLMDAGVKVYFFEGNHDVWTYRYFEELGMVRLVQPALVSINGRAFCLGHGDGLGPVPKGYMLLRSVFRLGNGWSKNNRLARHEQYVFKGEDEPLYRFALDYSAKHHVDYFIFGHYHADVRMTLPSGAEFIVLKDWIDSSPYLYFDGTSTVGGYCQNSE